MQEQILEQLIVEQIQLQRADRIGLQISDQMLNTALANIAAQNGIPFEDLPETLRAGRHRVPDLPARNADAAHFRAAAPN